MPGLGTIINVCFIIAGGVAGVLSGNRLSERSRETLMLANAVAVIFIGIAGALQCMYVMAEDGRLATTGTMMMIASLAIGALVGELIDLEGKIEKFGVWLRDKSGNSSDKGFVNAFVTASLTVCIGAMAVVGAIEDGAVGDHSILFAKAVLDLIIIMVMSASLGKGCMFSAIPVGLFQGSVTALAVLIRPYRKRSAWPICFRHLSWRSSGLHFCKKSPVSGICNRQLTNCKARFMVCNPGNVYAKARKQKARRSSALARERRVPVMMMADKIILERKKNGWSQEELADRLHVSRQSVSKWEGAQSVPDLNKVIAMAELFGVSTDYLLKDEIEDLPAPVEDSVSVDSEGEFVRKVSLEEAHSYLSAVEQSAGQISVGVMLCILSPIFLIIAAAAGEAGRIPLNEEQASILGCIVLLLIVAAAVFLFVKNGMQLSKYDYLEKEIIDTEYGVISLAKERKQEYEHTHLMGMTVGIILCVLSAVPVLGTSLADEENELLICIGVGITLALIAVGV